MWPPCTLHTGSAHIVREISPAATLNWLLPRIIHDEIEDQSMVPTVPGQGQSLPAMLGPRAKDLVLRGVDLQRE